LTSISTTPPPIAATAEPVLVQAAVELTVEVYRTKDAPWGVLDAWSADTMPVRISSDRLRSVRTMLTPYKARFGIG
jgi:hypothetical protein